MDAEIGEIIKYRILGSGLPGIVINNAQYFPIGYRGYMHVVWDDYYPQTGAFMKELPMNWKLFVIIQLPKGPAPTTPVNYTIT